MDKIEKDGMTYWYLQGGFVIVRTPLGRIYQYGQMFYGQWKVYPPQDEEPIKQFASEELVIQYLLQR